MNPSIDSDINSIMKNKHTKFEVMEIASKVMQSVLTPTKVRN